MSESQIGDVPLGQKGTDRNAPVAAFKGKGVRVAPSTIPELRAGRRKGKVIENNVLISEKLAQDDASLKNGFYLGIINKALELRTPQVRYKHRYDTNRYVEEIAVQLGKDKEDIRHLWGAMRADLVSANPDEADPQLAEKFRQTAEKFIADYSGPYPSSEHPPVRNLNQNWDHRTVRDFYRVMSPAIGVRFIATWMPYEMEIMSDFYKKQVAEGNRLTPFDRDSLGVTLIPTAQAPARTAADMGVRSETVNAHRNILVYGSPQSPLMVRKLR